MTTGTVALFTVLALAGTLPFVDTGAARASQDKKADQKSAPSVTGHWTMSVKGGPHGDTPMGLTLEQKGKKVTGTFATPHGDDLPVEGEFADGTLTIATPGGGDARITMTAKLKADDTLEGYLSSQMGDMTWTARRAARQGK
jgi:hypothetical protein